MTNHGSLVHSTDTSPMTVGQFLIMLLLSCIPLVGLILQFVWAFGSNVNQNKKNLARAMLIIMAIGVVLSVIFGAAMASIFATALNSIGNAA